MSYDPAEDTRKLLAKIRTKPKKDIISQEPSK